MYSKVKVGSMSQLVNCCHEHKSLREAVREGDLDAVNRLLEEEGASIDEQNSGGKTALYIAADMGSLQVVQYLVQRGAVKDKATSS